jgi:hypothetical protein
MPDLRFWLAFVTAFTIVVFVLMVLALIVEYWPWKRGK